MKSRFTKLFLLIFFSRFLIGYVDPLTVLEQLPSPAVKYPDAPKDSYPETRNASETAVKYKNTRKQIEKINEVVENGKEKFSNLGRIITFLAEPSEEKTENSVKAEENDQKSSNLLKNLETLAENDVIKSAKSLLDGAKNEKVADQSNKTDSSSKKTRISKPENKKSTKKKIPDNNKQQIDNKNADKEKPVTEDNNAQDKDKQTKQVSDENKASENNENKVEEEKTDRNENESKISKDETPEKSFDSVLAKAKGLQKKENWKAIKKLFDDNPEAGKTKDGLEYQIHAELNSAKPNYFSAKKLADRLIKLDRKNGLGNYALALYYYNAKRPNPTKASTHLAIALKAKNPPAGASKLYWTTMLKKFWLLLLIILAGIIGAIDYLRKKKLKKGKDKLKTETASSEQTDQQAEKPQPSGKAGQIKARLMAKIQPIIDKVKKRKKPEGDESEASDEAGKTNEDAPDTKTESSESEQSGPQITSAAPESITGENETMQTEADKKE